MIPDISSSLSWLGANAQVLNGIRRGIEREALRINSNGEIAQTSHPQSIGDALTHQWITTDFSESLMEFITPVVTDIHHVFMLLRDIHRYVTRHIINEERLWPMSMPCMIKNTNNIRLAQYGHSNLGRIKMLYREGLKNRYSASVQMLSGVHYNFSFPMEFWQSYTGITDEYSGKDIISAGYLKLVRNYYRFGWVIPYLFGASPGFSPSFLNERGKRGTSLLFKRAPSGIIYLPYATSLRLSEVGYTNKIQSKLCLNFNHLEKYVYTLKRATQTPSPYYRRIGLKKNGHYLQLSINILQMENELYTPIRLKSIPKNDESISDALIKKGIEYIEVRSLDINPFSPIGVDEEQACFLDLFLIWCTLAEAPEMSREELMYTRANWNRVIIEGRKPGLRLLLGTSYGHRSKPLLTTIGKLLFDNLFLVAKKLDDKNGDLRYQTICNKLVKRFDHPELTISARFLAKLKEYGIDQLGDILSDKYHHMLIQEPLEILSEKQFHEETLRSFQKKRLLELEEILSFDEILEKHQNMHH